MKFEPVVDSDPSTDNEPWPSKQSWRARNQPRCPKGHFVAKDSVKKIWPRLAEAQVQFQITCSKCDYVYLVD